MKQEFVSVCMNSTVMFIDDCVALKNVIYMYTSRQCLCYHSHEYNNNNNNNNQYNYVSLSASCHETGESEMGMIMTCQSEFIMQQSKLHPVTFA